MYFCKSGFTVWSSYLKQRQSSILLSVFNCSVHYIGNKQFQEIKILFSFLYHITVSRGFFCLLILHITFRKYVMFFARFLVRFSIKDTVAQMVKNPPAMQETQFWFLGQEDPLEEGIAPYSSILAWKIPWTEDLGKLRSIGSQRVRHDWSNLACTQSW